MEEDKAWIDPGCGCSRSPDVARWVPCPGHTKIGNLLFIADWYLRAWFKIRLV